MFDKEITDVESLYPQIIVPEETEVEKTINNIIINKTHDLHRKDT